jgi:propane monooxygenase reductase subunit
LVFVGGGAGMAPILSILRTLAERGSTRKTTFYYGARRRRDLCFEKELSELEAHLSDFHYVPALSEPDEEAWEGEVGLITDVLRRHESDLSDVDCYVCGPPPMVEAAMETLSNLGASDKRIYYDKFTTTAPS